MGRKTWWTSGSETTKWSSVSVQSRIKVHILSILLPTFEKADITIPKGTNPHQTRTFWDDFQIHLTSSAMRPCSFTLRRFRGEDRLILKSRPIFTASSNWSQYRGTATLPSRSTFSDCSRCWISTWRMTLKTAIESVNLKQNSNKRVPGTTKFSVRGSSIANDFNNRVLLSHIFLSPHFPCHLIKKINEFATLHYFMSSPLNFTIKLLASLFQRKLFGVLNHTLWIFYGDRSKIIYVRFFEYFTSKLFNLALRTKSFHDNAQSWFV